MAHVVGRAAALGSAPEGPTTDRPQDANQRAAIAARADATVARVRALTDDQIVPELAKVGLPFTTINEANREQHKERLLEKLLTEAEAESLSTRAWVEQFAARHFRGERRPTPDGWMALPALLAAAEERTAAAFTAWAKRRDQIAFIAAEKGPSGLSDEEKLKSAKL